MASAERLATPIVHSVDAVPSAFVRLSKFVKSAVRARGLRPQFVRDAVTRGRRAGVVDACKVCTNAAYVHYAPVFVHRGQAEAALLEVLPPAIPPESLVDPAPEPVAETVAVAPVGVSARVSAIVDPLVVELQALRASVAELTRGMADLRAAVELRTEAELCGTRCVDND